MLERSAGQADGDGSGPLLPAACFLGECQHRLSSLQRQLEAPPLNRKGKLSGEPRCYEHKQTLTLTVRSRARTTRCQARMFCVLDEHQR